MLKGFERTDSNHSNIIVNNQPSGCVVRSDSKSGKCYPRIRVTYARVWNGVYLLKWSHFVSIFMDDMCEDVLPILSGMFYLPNELESTPAS